MVFPFQYPFPEFYEDSSEDESKQLSKQDKASDRSKKSSQAAAGKDGRRTQKVPSSESNGGSNHQEKSSNGITDLKNTYAERPSKQPAPSRKSDVEKHKTRKYDGPSPPRSHESATGGKKPEKKSYSSPHLRNFMEIKDNVELRIRLRCKCEGCISRVRETVQKFKGVERVAVKADKDMVKVIASVEKKELVSYLEKKLGRMAYLPINDYDSVVDDHTEDEADGGPMTDCLPGISTTVQPKCQYSRDDHGIMLPGNEQKVASTVVLQIRQYCQEGCVQQTRKYVENFQGVESVDINVDGGQVKVTGTMKVEELVTHLGKKLKREVALVPMKRTENVTYEYKGLLQSGKNIVKEASEGYGVEVEKVAKAVEEPYQVKNAPDNRDMRARAVTKASDKSKAMPKVHVDNLNNLKNGDADLSCPQHNSQYGSVGDIEVHHLEKEAKLGAKGMHKGENISGGRYVRSHKASKRSEVGSRVHPLNLDKQTKVNPDLPRIKTQSGIKGDTLHHLEDSMEGKRQNKVTKLITFGLICDEDYLEKAQETAKNFEGVESAKIDMSKGLIVVTGAVDKKRLKSYFKEILKREVLEVQIQRNDILGERNKVPTNICGVNYGQVNRDMDVVQWSQKLNDDAARCGGDKYKHTGADGVNRKVKEVAAFGDVNGTWRKDKPGEAYTDIDNMNLQNYRVDPLFRWMSPAHLFVSPFSDEVVSCDEHDIYPWRDI